MLKTNLCTPRVEVVLEVLPSSLSREIRSVAGDRVGGLSSVSEIRVRSGGICSLVFSEGQLPLQTRVGEGELYSILSRLTDSSLYAYRDTITHGFISMPRGVRVGVCVYFPRTRRARRYFFATCRVHIRTVCTCANGGAL